jgi:hypothetical protein
MDRTKPSAPEGAARNERLGRALRDNLARRKAQQRGRAAAAPEADRAGREAQAEQPGDAPILRGEGRAR